MGIVQTKRPRPIGSGGSCASAANQEKILEEGGEETQQEELRGVGGEAGLMDEATTENLT